MSKKEQTHAVATQTNDLHSKALTLQAEAQQRAKDLAELGVEAKDLVIPSVQVMQNTSGLVGDDKAKLGEIVNMSTEEVLGGLGKPVKVLPLRLYKTLRVYDVSAGYKFVREEPLTAENEKLSGEALEDIEGRSTPVKRYVTMNYFVLLKGDLEKGEGFPCLLRFKSTGMNAGRSLATHLYKQVFFNKKPYASFVELDTKKEKKETNTYAVPLIDSKKGGPASAEDMASAENWLAMLAAGNYRVDDREDSEAVEVESVASAKPIVVDGGVVGSAKGNY